MGKWMDDSRNMQCESELLESKCHEDSVLQRLENCWSSNQKKKKDKDYVDPGVNVVIVVVAPNTNRPYTESSPSQNTVDLEFFSCSYLFLGCWLILMIPISSIWKGLQRSWTQTGKKQKCKCNDWDSTQTQMILIKEQTKKLSKTITYAARKFPFVVGVNPVNFFIEPPQKSFGQHSFNWRMTYYLEVQNNGFLHYQIEPHHSWSFYCTNEIPFPLYFPLHNTTCFIIRIIYYSGNYFGVCSTTWIALGYMLVYFSISKGKTVKFRFGISTC